MLPLNPTELNMISSCPLPILRFDVGILNNIPSPAVNFNPYVPAVAP